MNSDLLLTQITQNIISILLAFALVVGGGILIYKITISEKEAELRKLTQEFSELVSAEWTINDVQLFLESLPMSDLNELGDLTDKSGATAKDLANHLVWLSSSKLIYLFKDKNDVDYQTEILLWAAEENGVDASGLSSSFLVERLLFEKKFAQIWDRLTTQQRIDLLDTMNVSGLSDNQKAALVAGSGAAAVTALSATVAFSGFAFYTTMSTVIATSAGLLGITLPFGVYSGASSTVAVLSGPIGWGLALVAGTGAAIWATAPDADKTTAFILALHTYKAKRADEIKKQIQHLDGEVPAI